VSVERERGNRMNRNQLEQLKALPGEIARLEDRIDGLKNERVSDTVRGGEATESRGRGRVMRVYGYPRRLKKKLSVTLQNRQNRLEDMLCELETFIDGIEDSTMRQIIDLKYRVGLSDKQIGKQLHFDRMTINRKINDFFGDNQKL